MAIQPVRYNKASKEADQILHLWILRILFGLGANRDFIGRDGFCRNDLADVFGLGHLIASGVRDFDIKAAHRKLRRLHNQAEKQSTTAQVPACLRGNVARLATQLGLSATDCRILEFAVTIQTESTLADATMLLGQISSVRAFHAIAVILALPEADVRKALSAQGMLARTGLVALNRSNCHSLSQKLDLLSVEFADLMASSEDDPINLLRGTVSAAGPAQLSLADFAHVQPHLELLQPYLSRAVAATKAGVNIFLHGVPGTGKSQLARTLAQALGCELYEVASADEDGDPVHGEKRLRALRAAQNFLAQRRALIVFDEVEDVFNDGEGFLGRKSTAQIRKAWINRMLEENPVPTLWLSNSVYGLDPAFVRRFDMVFELPVPPKRQRERILSASCAGLLDARSIAHIAEAEFLAPALVTKAASVILSIRDELSAAAASAAFERLISSTLEAQGISRSGIWTLAACRTFMIQTSFTLTLTSSASAAE